LAEANPKTQATQLGCSLLSQFTWNQLSSTERCQ